MFGSKLILSVEVIKRHSELRQIVNGNFVSLSYFWKLMYAPSSGSKTETTRQVSVLHYDTFDLGKHCKQYHQKSLIKS